MVHPVVGFASSILEYNMRQFAAFRAFAASLVAALVVLPLSAAHAQVFSNNGAITIPSTGAATPYPSTIDVAGFVGTPGGLRVRLKSFSHTRPFEVGVLLVAPNGQGFELLSGDGGPASAFGLTLTFDTRVTTPLPNPLVTGTFAAAGGNLVLLAPGNAIPRAASLAALIAGSPNGQWRLFVVDIIGPGGGSIAGGWELDFILPTTPSSPSTFTYQGRLDGGVSTGTIDARFSLWSHPSTDDPANRLAAPVTVNGIAITNGLFTTPLNFGAPVPADIQTWLQVEISSPAGAPFVTLTPRQPITATPLAGAIASGGFAVGGLIGPGVVAGPNQHDVLNRGVKSRVGYATVPSGLTEFAGMITSVEPGTNVSGNSADVTFHTWEANTAFSREIMRINGRGNVGIGTTTPTNKLSVVGNADLSGKVGIGTTTPTNKLSVVGNADLSGNVGIGLTNPSARLHIAGGGGSPWMLRLTNTVGNGVGGIRMSDDGFLDATNVANGGNFARLSNSGVWGTVSDRRIKKDIEPAVGNLDAAMRLRPVTYCMVKEEAGSPGTWASSPRKSAR